MAEEILVKTRTHTIYLDSDMSLRIQRDGEFLPDGSFDPTHSADREGVYMYFNKQELTEALYGLIASDKTEAMQRTALRYMLAKAGFNDPQAK